MNIERHSPSSWFNKNVLALTIAGLMAAPALAQQNEQQNEQQMNTNEMNTNESQQQANFQDMDSDADELLVWREIHVVMDPRLLAANLDQEQIFSQYDEDGDSALNEQEFDTFLSDLEQQEIASSERGMEADTDSGTFSRTSAGSTIDAGATADVQHGADQSALRPESRYGEEGVDTSGQTRRSAQANQQAQSDRQEQSELTTRSQAGAMGQDSDTDRSDTSSLTQQQGDTSENRAASTSMRSQSATVDADSEYESETYAEDTETLTTEGTRSQTTAITDTSESQDQNQLATGQTQELHRTPIESLQNKTVKNSAGEEIGEVKKVVANPERGEIGFIVTTGGVMGIGKKEMFAPADELSLSEDDIVWETNKDRSELKESAKYRSEGYVEVSDQFETLDQIRRAGLSSL